MFCVKCVSQIVSRSTYSIKIRLQEDFQAKAAEKEAKKKEEAELESLRSKLRFTTIKLELAQKRVKELKATNAGANPVKIDLLSSDTSSAPTTSVIPKRLPTW